MLFGQFYHQSIINVVLKKSLGNDVLAMIFFFHLAYSIGANDLPYLYRIEILPYNQREKGINIMQVITLCWSTTGLSIQLSWMLLNGSLHCLLLHSRG